MDNNGMTITVTGFNRRGSEVAYTFTGCTQGRGGAGQFIGFRAGKSWRISEHGVRRDSCGRSVVLVSDVTSLGVMAGVSSR